MNVLFFYDEECLYRSRVDGKRWSENAANQGEGKLELFWRFIGPLDASISACVALHFCLFMKTILWAKKQILVREKIVTERK